MCVYTAFWQELQPPRLEQVGVSLAQIWGDICLQVFFSQIAQTEVAYSPKKKTYYVFRPFWTEITHFLDECTRNTYVYKA